MRGLRRYLALLLLIGPGVLLFWGRPSAGTVFHRAILDVPLMLVGIFLMSACELRVRNHRLEYRRFARWRVLADDSVRDLRSCWYPRIGVISAGHFVFPFGKIYFDLTAENEKQIAELLRGSSDRAIAGGAAAGDERKRARWCVIASAVGLILGVSVPFHRASHQVPEWAGALSWVGLASKVVGSALAWPWGLLTCALMAAWIARNRYRGQSWVLACAIGILVGAMALRIFAP